MKVRFIVHLENKEEILTDWDEGVTEEEYKSFEAACSNLKNLNCFVSQKDGIPLFIHPDKITHIQIEDAAEQEAQEDAVEINTRKKR